MITFRKKFEFFTAKNPSDQELFVYFSGKHSSRLNKFSKEFI